MHNSPKHNAEFQLTWCESNLRYLLGEDQNDPETIRKIEFMKSEIERVKILLAQIQLNESKTNLRLLEGKHQNDPATFRYIAFYRKEIVRLSVVPQ